VWCQSATIGGASVNAIATTGAAGAEVTAVAAAAAGQSGTFGCRRVYEQV